jgi:hypothetical protein
LKVVEPEQADPTNQSVQIFLTHNMLELQQMARDRGVPCAGGED